MIFAIELISKKEYAIQDTCCAVHAVGRVARTLSKVLFDQGCCRLISNAPTRQSSTSTAPNNCSIRTFKESGKGNHQRTSIATVHGAHKRIHLKEQARLSILMVPLLRESTLTAKMQQQTRNIREHRAVRKKTEDVTKYIDK
jgi:hypothetical protein